MAFRRELLLSSLQELPSTGPDEDGLLVEVLSAEEIEDLVQDWAEQNSSTLRDAYDIDELDNADDDENVSSSGTNISLETLPHESQDLSLLRIHGALPAIGLKFLDTDDTADLDEDIRIGREVVSRPLEHPQKAARLASLGVLLTERFARTGDTADLDEALFLMQEAVNRTPRTDAARAMYLDNLGAAQRTKYNATSEEADLESSISNTREAIEITAEDSADLEGYKDNLGLILRDRYLRNEVDDDLMEAISIHEELIASMSEDNHRLPRLLNALSLELLDRYLGSRCEADLDRAIVLEREAIRLARTAGRSPTGPLHTLGILLGEKYEVTRAERQIEEAIATSREAVSLVSENDHNRGEFLNALGSLLHIRFTISGNIDDLIEAISVHQRSLSHTVSPPATRVEAGKKVMEYCSRLSDWRQAYEASRSTINIFPELMTWSHTESDKQRILEPILGVASDAAAIALNAGQGPSVALQFLEQGRSLLATSIEDLRPDLEDLEKSSPPLAERFRRFRFHFDKPVHENQFNDPRYQHLFWASRERRHFEARKGLKKVILEIREVCGFEDFLKSPSVEKLKGAAKHGSIIVVNASRYRRDAILIEPHEIRSVPLRALDLDNLKQKSKEWNSASPVFLGWLWDILAQPILDALGYSGPPSANHWPRVHWILTGALAQIPIHAAGNHYKNSSDTVLDRVISSYSVSVKSILRRTQSIDPRFNLTDALLIAMEHTPGNSNLIFAKREVEIVRGLCKEMGLSPIEPPCKMIDVISALRKSKIFHFAGHGQTDPANPSKSHLLLESSEFESGRLSILSLRKFNIGSKQPFLAFLSACGTARMKKTSFLDEGIHLISAFQLLGFRHVIGTLWNVEDDLCADVARITYETIRNGGMSDESVSLGLHRAMRELRDRALQVPAAEKTLSRPARRDDFPLDQDRMSDSDAGNRFQDPKLLRDIQIIQEELDSWQLEPLRWIPYVHFGI